MDLDEFINSLQKLKKTYSGDTEVEVYLDELKTTLSTDGIKGVKKYTFKTPLGTAPLF